MVSRSVAGLAALAFWLIAPAALACPQCAGRAGGGIAQAVVLASFVFLPFAVAGVVIKYIKSEPMDAAGGGAQGTMTSRNRLEDGEKR